MLRVRQCCFFPRLPLLAIKPRPAPIVTSPDRKSQSGVSKVCTLGFHFWGTCIADTFNRLIWEQSTLIVLLSLPAHAFIYPRVHPEFLSTTVGPLSPTWSQQTHRHSMPLV
ncbi:hypothetical protein BDQ94DRAFT_136239 [Aspergillus welwitschiae]|uniref:Uncharacterized protein n=1 Tax=Aspergillus welwitschiae TaxID=1341132 RepID=A0A3F3QE68_9EURO|nr:hypothetical protein BDQ94DRAFT_136239 [Aspergillus welwitschiae]RDH37349.1 hypothetical protein BDQ94DRAFT_136239 [Aspergillus welwitschiae]